MNILLFWIFGYLLVSIFIGLLASRRVKNSTDYILAWRWLPLYIVIATTFATWFWSETVLWTSATFQTEWLSGILADPFGAWLCLILVWLFFAKPLYNLWIKTLGDFYKLKYGRWVELAASAMVIISYIGWVSAQIVALGLIFEILTSWTGLDFITQMQWSIIGGAIVLFYTFFGGMWSVAITDFMQMIIIFIGLIVATFFVTSLPGADGVGNVITHAIENNKFAIFPEWISLTNIIGVIAALLTMWFWSIPQQDVFQRVLSANNTKNASRGGIVGGSLYIIIAFLPILLGYSAIMVAPELLNLSDTQHILPTLILEKTPIVVQIFFFGALLSAIMSTASGTLLAPSALFIENILHPFFPKISDKKVLLLTRITVVLFFVIIIGFVVYKYHNEEANIFQMVENAYKITLAGAFVPLALWVFLKKVHKISAIFAMIAGISTWIVTEFIFWLETIYAMPPHFFGFIISIFGFFIGQITAKFLQKK